MMEGPGNKKSGVVTLKDIAAATNLTVATVSRALRNKSEIGDETKRRVAEVAKRLKYSTNHIARSLRTGESNIIGVVIPDNRNPFFAQIISEIFMVAHENSFLPIVFNSNDSEKNERAAIKVFTSFNVAGIIAIVADLDSILGLNVPVVNISRHYGEKMLEKVNYIVNDESGMILSVEHLLMRHKRLFYITAEKKYRVSDIRRQAFARALKHFGRVYDDSMVSYTDTNSMQGGYNAMLELLKREKLPFGVQCMSDYIALGVINAIFENNLNMPEDVSVVGHDDTDYCELLPVKLSSLKLQPDIGKIATEFLIKRIHGSDACLKMAIKPELIIRGSSG